MAVDTPQALHNIAFNRRRLFGCRLFFGFSSRFSREYLAEPEKKRKLRFGVVWLNSGGVSRKVRGGLQSHRQAAVDEMSGKRMRQKRFGGRKGVFILTAPGDRLFLYWL